MSDCSHTVTRGREGEKGSWCVVCGCKIYDVDDRECRDCTHFRPESKHSGRSGICDLHVMRVTANMHVTYKVADGTCFTAPNPNTTEQKE